MSAYLMLLAGLQEGSRALLEHVLELVAGAVMRFRKGKRQYSPCGLRVAEGLGLALVGVSEGQGLAESSEDKPSLTHSLGLLRGDTEAGSKKSIAHEHPLTQSHSPREPHSQQALMRGGIDLIRQPPGPLDVKRRQAGCDALEASGVRRVGPRAHLLQAVV